MCLIRMKVEHEDEETPPSPPRRIIVRPVSHHGSDRIIIANHISTSRPISRSPSHSHSHRSSTGRIISIVEPAPTSTPRASQYILSPSVSAPARQPPNRQSIPRIIHAAPSPSSSQRESPRGSPRHSNNSSPRVSYTSVHSTTVRPTSSRHNSAPGACTGTGGSPRGSRTRIIGHDGAVVYIATERERDRERGLTTTTTTTTTGGMGGQVRRSMSVRLSNGAIVAAERPRSMTTGAPYLTTAAAATAALTGGKNDSGGAATTAAAGGMDRYGYGYGYGYSDERDRRERDLDMGGGLRARSRSITYATTGGARMSRERVLVEEGGRRRESYQVIGGR